MVMFMLPISWEQCLAGTGPGQRVPALQQAGVEVIASLLHHQVGLAWKARLCQDCKSRQHMCMADSRHHAGLLLHEALVPHLAGSVAQVQAGQPLHAAIAPTPQLPKVPVPPQVLCMQCFIAITACCLAPCASSLILTHAEGIV